MTVRGRLELAAFDAPDIEKVAEFYTKLTSWEIVQEVSGWITVRAGDGQEVAFRLGCRSCRTRVARAEAPAAVPPRPAG